MDAIEGEEGMFRLDRLTDVVVADALPALAAEHPSPEYVAVDDEIEVALRLTTRAT